MADAIDREAAVVAGEGVAAGARVARTNPTIVRRRRKKVVKWVNLDRPQIVQKNVPRMPIHETWRQGESFRMSKKKSITSPTPTEKAVESPYHPQAFEFLRQGLDYTVRKTHGDRTDVVRGILHWLQEHQAELSQLPMLLSRGEIPPVIVNMIRQIGDLEAAADHLNLHVTGEDLCWGLHDLAVENWGLMAPVVLRHWGIRSTRDFGRMVFALIDQGLLAKQPDDDIEDFSDVYEFGKAFDQTYKIDLAANAKPARRASELKNEE